MIKTAKEMYKFDIEEDNVQSMLLDQGEDFLQSIKELSDGQIELAVEKIKEQAKGIKKEQEKVKNKDYLGTI